MEEKKTFEDLRRRKCTKNRKIYILYPECTWDLRQSVLKVGIERQFFKNFEAQRAHEDTSWHFTYVSQISLFFIVINQLNILNFLDTQPSGSYQV